MREGTRYAIIGIFVGAGMLCILAALLLLGWQCFYRLTAGHWPHLTIGIGLGWTGLVIGPSGWPDVDKIAGWLLDQPLAAAAFIFGGSVTSLGFTIIRFFGAREPEQGL